MLSLMEASKSAHAALSAIQLLEAEGETFASLTTLIPRLRERSLQAQSRRERMLAYLSSPICTLFYRATNPWLTTGSLTSLVSSSSVPGVSLLPYRSVSAADIDRLYLLAGGNELRVTECIDALSYRVERDLDERRARDKSTNTSSSSLSSRKKKTGVTGGTPLVEERLDSQFLSFHHLVMGVRSQVDNVRDREKEEKKMIQAYLGRERCNLWTEQTIMLQENDLDRIVGKPIIHFLTLLCMIYTIM
jgi:hypothetical protein